MQTFKRIVQVGLAAALVSGMNVGLGASHASAAGNTWIQGWLSGKCLEANNNADKVWAANCQWNNRAQLWSRSGAQIKRAYTNQCLDSNWAGDVYWGECNGGNFQNWDLRTGGTNTWYEFRNMETDRFLTFKEGRAGDDVQTEPYSPALPELSWRFVVGE